MKEQIETLIKLQKIEAEAGSVKTVIEKVPEKLQALDTRLREFEQAMAAESSLLDEMNKNYRLYESDVKENRSQIEKSKGKLASAESNKVYQAALKEIEESEAKTSHLEDDMLEYLDSIDQAGKHIVAKKDEYSQLKAELERKRMAINQEAGRAGKRLAKLDAERQVVSKKIDPGLMKKLTMLKGIIRGSVIAPVKDAICQGCNMNIPRQMYNDLQRLDSLKFCPHCDRMIYYMKDEG